MATVSFANAVCGPARDGLSLTINQLGASGLSRLSVTAFANRTTITCMDAGKGREQDAEALPARCALIQNRPETLNIIYIDAGLIISELVRN